MKSVILVRHAKSDWNDPSLKDFDRPLNDRGKRDAPLMAHRLLDKKIKLDALISSPAKRAKKTAELFAKEFDKDKNDIFFIDELYLAEPPVFFDVISKVDNDYKTIAIFSHNDGITKFANQLCDVRIDDIPTCGVFAVKADIKKWKEFSEAEREFWFFDSPKSNAG
ncbi:MAG: histidine phosphatase family protein [Chitinophagaceae bacterium]